MGFDVDLFEENISDEFICAICTGVLDNPQTTHCDHLFCDRCINDWLRLHPTCPIDRLHLRPCMLRPAPRAIRNLLSRLKLRCLFYEDGCRELVTLEHHSSHVESCKFDPSITVTCKLYCKRSMPQRDFKTHNCYNELFKELSVTKRKVKLLEEKIVYLQLIIVFLILLSIIMLFVDFNWLISYLFSVGDYFSELASRNLKVSMDFLKM